LKGLAAALLLCCVTALSWAAPRETSLRDDRIARLDEALSGLRQISESPVWKEAVRDLRGRVELQDQQQWAFPPDVTNAIGALVEQARGPEGSDDALDQAEAAMTQAATRSEEIHQYWEVASHTPSRKRWTAFAAANGLAPAPVDQTLLPQEKLLLAALEAGTFPLAARHAQTLEQLVGDAINTASAEVLRAGRSEDIRYVARTTPCPGDAGAQGQGAARLTEPANPDSWYPADAKRRGESGAIILRARVAASSCGTAFGVIVSSGFPELDAAAIKVAEASRYAASVENGKPVDGELTFKVRFEIRAD
jgi:TonB family protein